MKITVTNQEIWKAIQEYEGLYEVSNLGNIKSCRYNKIMSKCMNKWYDKVILHKNKVVRTFPTHRIVAQAFISNPENKPVINHKNWIRNDNRIDNLEWCTVSENKLHSIYVLWYKNSEKQIEGAKNRWLWNKIRSKKVKQFWKDGSFIKEWFDLLTASNILSINHWNMSLCAQGKRKTAWGFIFKYS